MQAFAKGGDRESNLIALCRPQYYYFAPIVTNFICHLLAVTKFTIKLMPEIETNAQSGQLLLLFRIA